MADTCIMLAPTAAYDLHCSTEQHFKYVNKLEHRFWEGFFDTWLKWFFD